MKHFKAKTDVSYSFPILKNGEQLDVYLKEKKDCIGTAKILEIADDQYLLDFSLDQEVDGDLYATVSQSKTNGITISKPYVTLSQNKEYKGFIQTIGSQQP